jgi:hypothetical protein
MRLAIAGLILLSSPLANAANIVVDFEGQDVDGWHSGTGPIMDNGFVLDTYAIGVVEWIGDSPKVVEFCTGYCGGDPFIISNVDNNSFDLLSFDMASFGLPIVTDFTITGNLAGGGILERQISLSQAITETSGVMETFYFDSGWMGLSSIEIDYTASTGFSAAVIDNIAVSVVPVPAAVWMFGSALAGLGWFRRKQTV